MLFLFSILCPDASMFLLPNFLLVTELILLNRLSNFCNHALCKIVNPAPFLHQVVQFAILHICLHRTFLIAFFKLLDQYLPQFRSHTLSAMILLATVSPSSKSRRFSIRSLRWLLLISPLPSPTVAKISAAASPLHLRKSPSTSTLKSRFYKASCVCRSKIPAQLRPSQRQRARADTSSRSRAR